jgi:hypothetical protein
MGGEVGMGEDEDRGEGGWVNLDTLILSK